MPLTLPLSAVHIRPQWSEQQTCGPIQSIRFRSVRSWVFEMNRAFVSVRPDQKIFYFPQFCFLNGTLFYLSFRFNFSNIYLLSKILVIFFSFLLFRYLKPILFCFGFRVCNLIKSVFV